MSSHRRLQAIALQPMGARQAASTIATAWRRETLAVIAEVVSTEAVVEAEHQDRPASDAKAERPMAGFLQRLDDQQRGTDRAAPRVSSDGQAGAAAHALIFPFGAGSSPANR
ncbi:hypothetical protein [Rhodopila sp.]|jgi:hypothetical protein|uniref:hypothetical protein n=1 Tax=Rhodopila sp. TaxID=2480087 RepID=UPI002CA1DF30|nr:hypothetical protein [Rhodopila sp.]HVZ10736.1 hypothetical protein [Rhodopila sp.]